ncbi:MAG TPA: hypothetical protein VFA34_07125 [Actinomycetota bacterium]|nr:hypothetical protein [Actinomycetota bacterium]
MLLLEAMNLEPDDLKREIDDALDELDRLEAEVAELFGEILGPDAKSRVLAYMRAKERDPKTAALRPVTSPAPWTTPPATP